MIKEEDAEEKKKEQKELEEKKNAQKELREKRKEERSGKKDTDTKSEGEEDKDEMEEYNWFPDDFVFELFLAFKTRRYAIGLDICDKILRFNHKYGFKNFIPIFLLNNLRAAKHTLTTRAT